MDGWLKALVAAACTVVIAGGAYFALSEAERAKNAAAAEQTQKMRASCATARPSNSGLDAMREYCREKGFY